MRIYFWFKGCEFHHYCIRIQYTLQDLLCWHCMLLLFCWWHNVLWLWGLLFWFRCQDVIVVDCKIPSFISSLQLSGFTLHLLSHNVQEISEHCNIFVFVYLYEDVIMLCSSVIMLFNNSNVLAVAVQYMPEIY